MSSRFQVEGSHLIITRYAGPAGGEGSRVRYQIDDTCDVIQGLTRSDLLALITWLQYELVHGHTENQEV